MARPARLSQADARHGPVGSEPLAGGLVGLDHGAALDPQLVGAKAAALARARRAGLPVLPGMVLPVGMGVAEAQPALLRAWTALTAAGTGALVVRSSSTVEDGTTSSMAGRFTSVLDVRSTADLLAAVAEVRASAGGHPMAVLLQPMLDAARGGVLFGVDPITGRTDRLLVEVVPGGPAALVAGQATGARYVLRRSGRVVDADERRELGHHDRRTLAAAARTAALTFGGPQDIEWAIDGAGRFWLLQSRPVTATAPRPAVSGPVFGPGPVAETLPGALTPLEEALWVEPLRDGVRGALGVLGVVPARTLRRSPLVVTVGGRVAADLELLGGDVRRGLLRRFDPRPPGRRLAAAWRVGRLRRAMPLLAADLIQRLDDDLAAVPALRSVDDAALVDLLQTSRQALRAVHGHEVLAGVLGLDAGASGAAHALAALAAGRREGLSDAAIVARTPEVLALSGPAIAGPASLPPIDPTVVPAPPEEPLAAREALRLRARWLQELTAMVAAELGRRLHGAGRLSAPGLVRWLQFDELARAVAGGDLPAGLAARATTAVGPPLPASFRLAADGTAVGWGAAPNAAGRGAGAGRATGPVHHGLAGTPPAGSVLVVDTLEPGLAGWLPQLAGIVAETGSVLSHLAILARELGVPAVVGLPDARARFPEGSTVLVDGSTGEVALVEGADR